MMVTDMTGRIPLDRLSILYFSHDKLKRIDASLTRLLTNKLQLDFLQNYILCIVDWSIFSTLPQFPL